MIQSLDGASQKFLADLRRIDTANLRAQRQISSGLRIERPSDAPDEIRSVLQARAEIGRNQQIQMNLGRVRAEVDTAEQALQLAVTIVERARALGTDGADDFAGADSRILYAQELAGLQQQLVGTTQTMVEGRYIFGGDAPDTPPYELNASSPTGVNRLTNVASTRQVEDADGMVFTLGRTAQEIFDHRNADDTPASDNVFAALQGLRTALENNDTPGIDAALLALRDAGDHLSLQLGHYGHLQNRVTGALDRAKKLQLHQETDLGAKQDADLPAAALELERTAIHREAALAARAQLARTNLFSLLG